MSADRLAELAGLLADRTRARMCVVLLDGRAWTAGELASTAGVSRSTASEHLTRLVDAGLLTEHRQGRHRYVALADARAAALVEDMLAYSEPVVAAPASSLRAVTAATALARGRTCYDHLAGHLGVAITDAMADRDLLDEDLSLTPDGRRWLSDALGADFTGVRRPVTRSCLDWTERRLHLAGAAGAHLCTYAFEHGWIRRVGSGRAVRPTDAGREAFADLLGLDV